MNLADLLTRQALATPDCIAAINGEMSLTLASMEAAVWSVARHLRNAGLKSGNVVGLLARDPLLHLIATFALARMGVVQLALSDDGPVADQNAELLRRTGAIAVIADRPAAEGSQETRIRIDREIAFASDGGPDMALRHDGQHWPLMYKSSSGTTGKPKLVGATHDGMIASVERELSAVGYLPGERYLTPVAMQFDAPKRRYIACIVSGSTAVMPPPVLAIEPLFDLIDRYDVRHFSCVPRQAYDIVDAIVPGRQRFPNMRCFRLSAAPSDAQLLALLRERVCSNIAVSYGCSELGPMTFASPEMVTQFPQAVGRPMPGIAVQVVSATDEPVEVGDAGIVRVRANGMPVEYLGDPDATARYFRNGWFYPGDLGAISSDGALTLMGRADDMMIFEGINIAPMEIEQVLQSYAGVREAAAFPLRSRQSYQMPAAAVVLDDGVDLNALIRFARTRLGRRAPVMIVAVNKMPRNQGGKIVKRALAELAENNLDSFGNQPL